MAAPHDRPAKNPGGMECQTCDTIFVGEEWHDECAVCDADRPKFDAWIATLKEDVIQEEYGYEPGEFDVFPSLWHGLYKEGLTPSQAFERALDDYGNHR